MKPNSAPNRRGTRNRPSESRGERENPRDRDEREFNRELEMRLQVFVESEDEELELEPMNSYRRHLVHDIAQQYNLESASRGEDRDRRVCLIRTPETRIPETQSKVRAWDYGTQSFPVSPGPDGIRVALLADGGVEILPEGDRRQVLDHRVVTAREFRIRRGKIVQPGEPNW